MYIEEYEIVSLGTKYTGKNHSTEKKNQVVARMHSDDGIHSKEFLHLLENFDDSVHRHSGKNCKITVEFKDTE